MELVCRAVGEGWREAGARLELKGGWKAVRDKLAECWKEVGGRLGEVRGRREVDGSWRGGYKNWRKLSKL